MPDEEKDEKKGGGGPGGSPNDTPKPAPGAKPEVDEALAKRLADTEAKLAEVTKESIERRQENKELRTFRDSLASLFGAKEPEKVKAEVEEKERRANEKLIRAAAISVLSGAGAHSPKDAVKLLDLSGLDVDENGDPKDGAALSAKVDALKASNAWAFKSEKGEPPKPEVKPGTPTPTPPAPKHTDGKTPYEAWRSAMDRKDLAEAQRLWKEHPEIRTQVRLVQ